MSSLVFTLSGAVPTASAEITVSKRLVTATAPDMVVFEITNFSGFDTSGPAVGEVYNPRYHDLYYFWDFGDTTYSSFSAPTRVRSAHNNPNVMYGPFGRHVYRSAGSYSPKCTIYEPSSGKFAIAYLNAASTDSGTAGTATAALDVADPDTTFAGSQTIFVSASGDFTNAPFGATQVNSSATTVDAIINTYIEGQPAGTPLRLMFNRGESYDVAINGIGNGNSIPTIHMVAGPGAGAKPVVDLPSSSVYAFQYNDTADTTGNIKDIVFDNIDFTGPVDATTGGAFDENIFFATPNSAYGVPATAMFHQCSFDGFGTLALSGSGDQAKHFAVVDCSITNWQEAGIYDFGADFTTFLGTSIKSPPLALTDFAGSMGAPYRGGKTQQVVFACDIFSKQGWGGLALDKYEEQTCLRINAEGDRGAETYVGCNVLEGARVMLRYTISGVGTSQACNHICEKNFFLASAQTDTFIQLDQAGVTIRNNVMSWGAINRSEHNGAFAVVDMSYPGTYIENRDSPIKIYSNTASYLSDGTSFSTANFVRDRSSGDPFSDVTDRNNIVHQPNASAPTDLGLAAETNDFLPLRIAYIDSNEGPDYDEGTAHSALDFDAQTAAFTLGAVLTGGTSGATARINYIQDNGTTGTLWLGEVTGGPFVDGETITDTSTGSATVNGAQRDSGFTDDFIPLTGSSVIGAYSTGAVAYDDFYGNIRDDVLSGLTRSAYSTGAHEPNLES